MQARECAICRNHLPVERRRRSSSLPPSTTSHIASVAKDNCPGVSLAPPMCGNAPWATTSRVAAAPPISIKDKIDGTLVPTGRCCAVRRRGIDSNSIYVRLPLRLHSCISSVLSTYCMLALAATPTNGFLHNSFTND